MRTRHPFPDVELEQAEPESIPVRIEHPIPGVAAGGAVLVERGTAVPLGFMPHRAENRKTRRAAVANWQPPKITQKEGEASASERAPQASPATYPTRRELWRQRKRQRRGKLDPELRAAQRERLK